MNSENTPVKDTTPQSLGNRLAPAVLMLFAAILRLYELGEKSLWLEEAKAFQDSARSLSQILLLNGSSWYLLWQNVALHVMQWISNSEFAIRLPSALAGVAAVGLFYRYLRKRFDNEVAFVGGFILSLLPGFIMQSQEAATYSILVCLTIVVLLRIDRFIEHGGHKNGVFLALSYIVLIFTHPYGLYLLLPITLYLLVREIGTISDLKRYGAVEKLFVGTVVLAVIAATLPFFKLLLTEPSLSPLADQPYHLWKNTNFFAITFNFMTAGKWWPPAAMASEPLVWLFAIGFLAATFLYRQKMAALWREQLWFWGMLIPAFLMVNRVITEPRYLIAIIVPATAIWSVGVTELARRAATTILGFKNLENKIGPARLSRALTALALALTSFFFLPELGNYYNDGHHYLNVKGDFKSAAKVVSENWKPGDLFFLVGNLPATVLAQYYLPQIVDYPVDFRPAPNYSAILNEAGKTRRSYVLISNQQSWKDFITYNQQMLIAVPSWHFLDWHLIVLDVPSTERKPMKPWSTEVDPQEGGIRQAEQYTTIYRKYPQIEVNQGHLALKAEVGTGLLYLFDLPADGRYKLTIKAMSMHQENTVWIAAKINGFETLPMDFGGWMYETDSAEFEAKAGIAKVNLRVGREGFYGESGSIAIDLLKVEKIN